MEEEGSILDAIYEEEDDDALDEVDDVEMLDVEEGEISELTPFIDFQHTGGDGDMSDTAGNQASQSNNQSRNGNKKSRKQRRKKKGGSGPKVATNIDRFVSDTCRRLREKKSYMVYTAVGCLGLFRLTDLVTEIGPLPSSYNDKARVKVRVQLNLHGIVTIDSAMLMEDYRDVRRATGQTDGDEMEVDSTSFGSSTRPPNADDNENDNLGTTIAAIVTSIGGPVAAVGIVRLSGPSAVGIASRVFRPMRKRKKNGEGLFDWRPTSHVVDYGVVLDNEGNVIDEVLALPMLSPRSYTCEDVVELQCHGTEVCLNCVLRACLAAGATLAEPGNVCGCVFCPQMELFLHPVDGCPANGRQSDKMMESRNSGAIKRVVIS